MASTKTDIPLHQLAVTSGAVLTSKTGAKLLEFDVPMHALGGDVAATTSYFKMEIAASAGNNAEISVEGAARNAGLSLKPQGTGSVIVSNFAGTSTSELRIQEDADNGGNYVGLTVASTLGANYTLTLPKSAGTAGFALCLGANVSDPLLWKESLTDGGTFDELTLGDLTVTKELKTNLLEIDVASGSSARLLFDTNDDDKWVLGVTGDDEGIFRINLAASGGAALSAGYIFQLHNSGAAQARKAFHVGAVNSGAGVKGSASLVSAMHGSAAFLRLAENSGAGSNFAIIKTAPLAANTFFTLPNFGAPAQFVVGSTASRLPLDTIVNRNFTIAADNAADKVLLLAEGSDVKFSIGCDNSDSNNFKIHSGTSIADDSDFEIDASGNVEIKNGTLTVTNDSTFSAKLTAGATSVASLTVGEIGLHLKGSDSAASTIVFSEDTDNGSNKLELKGPQKMTADQVSVLPADGGDLISARSMVWGDMSQVVPDGDITAFPFAREASINGGAIVFRNGVVALPTMGGEHLIGKVKSVAAFSAGGLDLSNSAGLYLSYGETIPASTTNDHYNGWQVYITDGTGAGQQRTITDFNGTGSQVLVTPAFSTAVDKTSVYVLIQNDYTFIAKHNNSATGTGVAYFAKDNQGMKPQTGDVIYAVYPKLGSSVA